MPIPATWYTFFLSFLFTGPTEFKTQDVPWPLTRTMYLTPSVPNLGTLVQYLSVRGCQTWQSSTPSSGNSKTQLCRKLPTVTSHCWNEIPASRKVPPMHTSPPTPVQPCKSDPTLAIRHTITQTPTRILPRPHDRLPKTRRTYTRWKENLLWQNPLSLTVLLSISKGYYCIMKVWLQYENNITI